MVIPYSSVKQKFQKMKFLFCFFIPSSKTTQKPNSFSIPIPFHPIFKKISKKYPHFSLFSFLQKKEKSTQKCLISIYACFFPFGAGFKKIVFSTTFSFGLAIPCFAISHNFVKPSASFTAISASILRLIATSA